ncbi:alkaline shock response membrane anchor protein AmaP [Caldicellulosiruptor changbaiensis]|uniref:Alkaline shock response membrane anchor protein AmaP n=1 Tax=Caldicellulosiruptor changbaiensis TaxID=1222016 RepID=A0A3T0D532_9FIRM|nr:alkaline shock response membrane anchor protein AmaP [Caldicellulosiruptor changbaiensis]AZT90144.1 alkaline shock response membrane anchor protein AmaP [Caldicellulosiruptor changbaiensis]
MKIGERILLTIFTLIVIVAAIFAILLPLNVFSVDIVQSAVYEYINNPIYGLVPLAIIVMGFAVMFIGIKKKRVRLGIIHTNELGNLVISPKTFESAGYSAIKDIKGIKDATIEIEFDESGVEYHVDALVINDVNIPELTKEVQNAIKNHVETSIGIPVKSVNLHVKDMVAPQTSITHLR